MRHPLGRWVALLLLPVLAACNLGTCNPSFEPLDPEQPGVMIAPRADGIEVECRGVERERCRQSANGVPGIDTLEGVERVVVSCVGRCTARGGELRMDVVIDDEATFVANGGYGEFEQSCQ